MYNHYFPSENGVFERRSMQEPIRDDPVPCPPPEPGCPATPEKKRGDGLLGRLLPKDLDTGDLLLILILLLLMQDGGEDSDTLVLTILAFLLLW